MSLRAWCLSLMALLAVAAGIASPSRAAGSRSADPGQGAVSDGAYVNRYFGLRYSLPPGCICTFTAPETAQLQRLAASLARLSLEPSAAIPDCVNGYATAIRERSKPG
jgi:hypothetical protein